VHRKEILETALSLTLGDRETEYGPMTETMARVAAAASAVLGKELTARDIAVINVVMKLTRSRQSPTKADHYVDGAAYIAMAGECAKAV
jgi:hypothetical protein